LRDHAPLDRNRHDDRIRAYGADLLRIKGVLNVDGSPGPFAVHGVQHLFHPPVELPAWPDDDHASRIVFITRNMAETTLAQGLAAFKTGTARPA
jgi:G3E family GTPase